MTTEKYSFDDATKKAEQQANNSLYIMLDDGQTVKGMFAGEVIVTKSHYLIDQKKTVNCSGDESCVHCVNNIRVDIKYCQNFIVYNEETKEYEVKIFKLSGQAINSLKEALILSEISRDKAVIAVKRTGKKIETKYHFQVIKSMEMPADIKLIDIEKVENKNN